MNGSNDANEVEEETWKNSVRGRKEKKGEEREKRARPCVRRRKRKKGEHWKREWSRTLPSTMVSGVEVSTRATGTARRERGRQT